MAVGIDEWIERDLGALAATGELAPAYEVDDLVAQAEEILAASGRRSPVLVGPPGVGKSAVVHELVRRGVRGEGAALLGEARVVQLSLRGIAARFKEKADGANLFHDLCDQIAASATPVVPFIRDVHLAYSLDWEPVLHRLLEALPHPILAEAAPRQLEQMLEYWNDLGAYLVPLPVEEPRTPRVRKIVAQWCAARADEGRAIERSAQRTAIELTARFMGDRPFPRKVLDLLRETLDVVRDAEEIGVPEVVARFSRVTRVPAQLVDPDAQLDLGEVHQFVRERLLGQAEAVDAVVRMIAMIKAGLADLRRPFGAFLFVGPTGVGKTHCAQLLAQYLFGDRNRLIRLNMADYQVEHDAQVLFGDPNASSPRAQRGVIATRLQGHPFGVLLLDEFEKAHTKIHDAFLQLVDEGRYINGRSETVSVTSLIVIATSNAGASVYRKVGLGFEGARDAADLDRELDRLLRETFRFELINRFDRVVHFHPLSRTHIRQIALRELTELTRREGLVGRGLGVDVDAEVLDWLVSHGYHPHYGARFLRREIERSVAGTLAEFIVKEHPPRGSRLALGVRRDRIEARDVSAAPTPRGAPPRAAEPARDRGRLLAEVRAWAQRWAGLAEESRQRQVRARELIEASNERGFWDDHDKAQEVLRGYKTLDARVQADRRLLGVQRRLARVLEAPDEATTEQLATAADRAASSYRRWLDLGEDHGPAAAWLIVGAADLLSGCSGWLVDLVAMYRGWLRRKGMTYEVVAEEVRKGEVGRLVLEVEGPGVGALLAMERGEHRRRAPRGGLERAVVDVLPRTEGGGDFPHVVVEDARRARGVAIARRTARLKLALPAQGVDVVLHGSSADTLRLLGRDLGAAFVSRPELAVARIYGVQGGAVRDPRTHASVARVKDVLRGDLEPFLRAWEAR